MISPEHKKGIEDLARTHYGEALRAYLNDELVELDSIRGAKTIKELEGRQAAIKIIEKLFYFMGERKAQGNSKNQYV